MARDGRPAGNGTAAAAAHKPGVLLGRFRAETEQLIDTLTRKRDDLIEEATQVEDQLEEARAMMLLLKHGRLN
jgi:ATP-dependent protease HslVU (ClpYQ) peptidase subunit